MLQHERVRGTRFSKSGPSPPSATSCSRPTSLAAWSPLKRGPARHTEILGPRLLRHAGGCFRGGRWRAQGPRATDAAWIGRRRRGPGRRHRDRELAPWPVLSGRLRVPASPRGGRRCACVHRSRAVLARPSATLVGRRPASRSRNCRFELSLQTGLVCGGVSEEALNGGLDTGLNARLKRVRKPWQRTRVRAERHEEVPW